MPQSGRIVMNDERFEILIAKTQRSLWVDAGASAMIGALMLPFMVVLGSAGLLLFLAVSVVSFIVLVRYCRPVEKLVFTGEEVLYVKGTDSRNLELGHRLGAVMAPLEGTDSYVIALQDSENRTERVAASVSREQKQDAVERINRYLKEKGRDFTPTLDLTVRKAIDKDDIKSPFDLF